MHKTKLLLLSSSCLAVFFYLNNAYAQNQSAEEVYSDCVSAVSKRVCDSFFKALIPNFTQPINSTNLSNLTYLTYNDNDLGFSIQYPSDWTIGGVDSQFNDVANFKSPQYNASVNIRIFPKEDYKTIKDYGDTFKESNNEYKLLKYYRNSSTTLSGKPAFMAIYLTTYNPSIIEKTYGYKSSTSKAMMVATMVPEKDSIYAIAYFSNPTDFDNYIPIVEKMIDSFKIYGKGPVIQEDNISSAVP